MIKGTLIVIRHGRNVLSAKARESDVIFPRTASS
jgi:hypothetical protein